MEAVEGCGAISGGIAIIYHSIEDVVKGVKGHFEYGVKVDGMAMESKFASDVRLTNKQTCLLNHGRLPLRVVTLPMLYA